MSRPFRLFGLAAISASLSLAQQAALSGYVQDPTGAVVPKANIAVVKMDTAAKWSTSSSDVASTSFRRCRQGLTRYTSTRLAFSHSFAGA